MNPGDKVKIVGKPQTMSKYSNDEYESFLGKKAKIVRIYKYGDRNVLVESGKYGSLLYYSSTDLQLL